MSVSDSQKNDASNLLEQDDNIPNPNEIEHENENIDSSNLNNSK